MRLALITFLLVICSALACGGTVGRVKIDTVADTYMPTNATVREPVSMQYFRFEVEPETSRARVVVEYTYPDQLVYEKNDDQRGPRPTVAQIPGLKYDSAKHDVVFEAGGRSTVCAHVREHKGVFGPRLRIENTGACLVTAEDTKHAEDDGWKVRRFRAIDVYFEVH